MNDLDEINAKGGASTLRTASVPVSPEWGMRRKLKAPVIQPGWMSFGLLDRAHLDHASFRRHKIRVFAMDTT